MNINKANIANALHSVAKEHIVATADEIYDNSREQYQNDVNEAVGWYTKSQEFVALWLDSEKHILFGIQDNGNIFYGAGVPQQVKDYIDKQVYDITHVDNLDGKIDTIHEIIKFLDSFKDDDTLAAVLTRIQEDYNGKIDKKVDKEENKSLIDAEYAEGIRYIENPDFVEVKLDADKRIVEATYKNGTKLLPAGIETPAIDTDSVSIKTISNPEFIALWLDATDHILMGIQNDGSVIYGCGVPNQIKEYVDKKIAKIIGDDDTTIAVDTLKEITVFLNGFESGSNLLEYLNNTYGEYVENEDYIVLKMDGNKKILEGYKKEGVKYLGTPIENDSVRFSAIDNKDYLYIALDGKDRVINAIPTDGDVIYGGVNISSIKRSIDESVFGVEYDENSGDIYTIETADSTLSMEYDEKTGDVYSIIDSNSEAILEMNEVNGDIYLEY